MSTQKTVYSKLFKQELAAEKVELAIQKIELSIISEAESLLDKGLDAPSQLRKLASSARGVIDKGNSNLKQSKARFELAIKQLKEIGLDNDPKIKEFQKKADLCEYNIKRFADTQKWINFIG